MALSRPSRGLYALAALGLGVLAIEAASLSRIRRRRLPSPARHPGCSILKPLSGLDPELERDLSSHAAISYRGEWEVLLGVEGEADPALPLAREFARRHPDRVRVVVHAEQSGHHPKARQLIALTREASHEILVVTDADVRVPPGHLDEVVAALEQPGVGLVMHMVAGVGERRIGAIFDNQAWLAFVAPNVAMAATLGIDQIVGKSIAIPRGVLERIGGWEVVKDEVVEDNLLGPLLGAAGLRSYVCPTPVQNVQVEQGLGAFWARQTRWAMARFRVVRPGFFLEPLLNPAMLSATALALSPRSRSARGLTAAIWVASIALAEVFARLVRGHGFRPLHLALFPIQQFALLLAWARGATMRTVTWHGQVYDVGSGTRLSRR